MATKAQKRAAGLAKRKAFEAEQKASGLAAQTEAQQRREQNAKLFGIEAQRQEARLREAIVEHATELGTAISKAELAHDKVTYETLRQEWRDVVEGLGKSPHKAAAHGAYWDAVKAVFRT